jgi:hypothetical protein
VIAVSDLSPRPSPAALWARLAPDNGRHPVHRAARQSGVGRRFADGRDIDAAAAADHVVGGASAEAVTLDQRPIVRPEFERSFNICDRPRAMAPARTCAQGTILWALRKSKTPMHVAAVTSARMLQLAKFGIDGARVNGGPAGCCGRVRNGPGGWLADDTVLIGPVSNPEFPENREINREFFSFGRFSAIFVPNRRANSAAYNKIPYAAEQGIFFTE